jgi:hypothetical protein
VRHRSLQVRNALLEMVQVPQNYNGGCAYANWVFVAAEGFDFFKLGIIATGGRLSHQATCLLWKGFWLDGSLGVEPRVFGSLWLMASATWGGGEITSAEGLHDWERRAVPLLSARRLASCAPYSSLAGSSFPSSPLAPP